MIQEPIVRETPTVPPAKPDASKPAVEEDVIAVENVQGNIGGFSKDFQRLLFFSITDPKKFKSCLGKLVGSIATMDEVLSFNRLFKRIRRRRGRECPTVQATWINIAFSFGALELLGAPDLGKFADKAFKQGMAARAVDVLSDPASSAAEGNPGQWTSVKDPHVIVIIASDDEGDANFEAEFVLRTLGAGATVIGEEIGRTLPGQLTGHEHFGFLDGVSQPGVRGRYADEPHALWTPRQNANNPDQGKPGQDLLWPGEFIFGYPGQDPSDKLTAGPNSLTGQGPEWAMDGSFFVFRKLRQAVGEFHSFVNSAAGQLGMSPDELGARLVGRWRDGAPIMRSDTPNQALGDDDCANNNFEFREDSEQVLSGDDGQCLDKVHPTSKADPDGKTCPFAAHIRKAYPRDDTSDSIDGVGEDSTQTHRLLRRGIPFGAASASTLDKPVIGEVDGGRGLLFMCYQTSIEDGFEFVQRMWANNPTFANELADKGGNGHDPIIGQTNENGRKRFIVIRHKGKETKLELPVDWIFTQGGGYFFSPSIAALGQLSKGFK